MIPRLACIALAVTLSQGRVHHEPAFSHLSGAKWGSRRPEAGTASTLFVAKGSSSPSDCRFHGRSHYSPRRSSSSRWATKMMVASNKEASLQVEPARGAAPLPALNSPAGAALAAEGINQKEWEALLEAGEVASLGKAQLLISQGDTYDHPGDRELYLLLRGELQIEVQGKPVGRIGTGDFVGEASFTSGRPAPRTATVRAKRDDTTVVAWTWDGLGEFMGDPANLRTKAALQTVWMAGLAGKLNDVMSALGGQSVIKDAEKENVQAGDYGYRYLEDTREVDSIVPVSAFTLSWWTFAREYRALRRTFRFGEFKDTGIAVPFSVIDRFLETSVFPVLRPSRVDLPRDPEVTDLQRRLSKLKLSNKAIEDREIARIAATKAFLEEEARKGIKDAGNILRSQTPWFVMVPYKVLCWFLDVVFEDRPIQRFWFLETVARMPYFAYLSMLFLFETLGWWSGGAEVRKVHFAEEYNELQHLRIMESLGGDTLWSDRFLARHAAVVYFGVLTLGYLFSPFLAYNFSELIESHAVDTYTEFIEANEDLLKSLPPTPQALDYYHGGDMYLFDEFQTARPAFSRRPVIKNLYDVFSSIRDDEMEHVKTMFACERGKGSLTSPNAAAATPRWAEDATTGPPMSSATAENIRRNKAKRKNYDGDDAGAGAESGGDEVDVWGKSLDNSLRTDIVQKTPLETLTAAFDPLRDLIDEAEKSGIAEKLRPSPPPSQEAGVGGQEEKEEHGGVAGSGTGGDRLNVSDFEESEPESPSGSQDENHSEKR